MKNNSVSFRIPFLILLSCFAMLFGGCGQDRDAMLLRASEALEVDDPIAAQSIYLNLLERRNYDSDAIQGMIGVSKALNRREEHIHWCKKLLKYRPWDRYANLAVGIELMEKGELADAGNRLILAYMDSVFTLDREETLHLLRDLRRRQAQLPQEQKTPEQTPHENEQEKESLEP